MKKNDPELEGLLHGETGLWSAVLLNILNEIETPELDGFEQSRRIVMDPDKSCLPFIAAALGLDTGELQRKIFRYLKKKRVTI